MPLHDWLVLAAVLLGAILCGWLIGQPHGWHRRDGRWHYRLSDQLLQIQVLWCVVDVGGTRLVLDHPWCSTIRVDYLNLGHHLHLRLWRERF